MSRLFMCLYFALCAFVHTNSEFITKKLCKDVDSSQCSVHNVIVEPCTGGPSFCRVKRNKFYTVTMDFTPHFSAQTLKLAMYGDDQNSDEFSKEIKLDKDGCNFLTCPLETEMRRNMDINFSLDNSFNIGKYPVKLKIWNDDDETEACCFTFNVKIHK